MAVFVLKDVYCAINHVDLSDHVQQVSLPYEAEELDGTTMIPEGAREFMAGLVSGNATVQFAQDFETGEVDETLFPLVGAPPFPVVMRPVATAANDFNPEFSWNAILTSYPIIDGSRGDLATASVTLRLTGRISRDTYIYVWVAAETVSADRELNAAGTTDADGYEAEWLSTLLGVEGTQIGKY